MSKVALYDDLDFIDGYDAYLDEEPFTGVAISKDEEGVIREEQHYKNGVLHGPIMTYDEDGKMRTIGHYKKGSEIGVWKQWEEGVLIQESEYKRTTYNPDYLKQYYLSEKLKLSFKSVYYGYTIASFHSIKKEWYESGVLKSVVLSDHGYEVLTKEWDEKGNLTKSKVIA